MERFFHHELEAFRSNLILMGEKALEVVRLAMRSLEEGDPALAEEVLRRDDEIDQLEVAIDAEAIRYISLRHPIASELRLLAVGMKTGHDLERVGDEATSIAKRARKLGNLFPVSDFRNIPEMGELAVEMLQDTLDCLANEDEPKALSICKRDKLVDELNLQNYKEFSRIMGEHPENVPTILELLFVSKSIERIADHATNIAEEIVYLLRGETIRHTSESRKNIEDLP